MRQETEGQTRVRDWTTQAADVIVNAVESVRDHTVVPLRFVVRAIAYGIIAIALSMTIAGLLMVGSFRLLATVFEGDVWAAHAILGGILLVAGRLCWARARF